ncbi:hypothetical protein K7402_01030 [Pseudomonas fluorescens group sp.]|uniref:Uncharacterized protein n=2 Tax=Pseudomonas fluorescens TaxID=294 RepID=C3KCZ6_PSEFS|nr:MULTISPECIES: hypothetical protein [Pseudomonas fluorescens group]MBZ6454368.1 hypothetical protein [Pseudomonas fluorescens group sp.]MBZ6460353.1 hypothetical protein [Pseudomonas fluorescens group sp.]MBZ6465995.1 hypothetical protein [Pseudomonas fluorescens group sp.]WQD69709.1 hypothetical protein U0037_16705 [Pseudomonas marginalis]CAI2797557.1 Uncharacterized protein PFLU_3343 [Pseudomonas fluorescens SBW25]
MGQAKARGTKQAREALAKEVASLVSGDKYRLQMIEVKRRFRAAARILNSDIPLSGDTDIDNECAFAQVRRIVELIAFSALIADRGHYEAQRLREAAKNDKDKGDYTADWKAGEILKRLKKVNTNFLPQSAGDPVAGPDNTKHIPYGAIGPKTHSDLITIYQTASRYLHTSNPFAADLEARALLKLKEARSVLQADLALLRGIIWKHNKFGLMPGSSKEAGKRFVWMVDLRDEESNEVEIYTALQDT